MDHKLEVGGSVDENETIHFLYAFVFSIIHLNNSKFQQAKKNDNISCDRKTENQIDAAFARTLVYGQKGATFPENPQQLRNFCNEAKQTTDKVGLYSNRCLNKFGRDTTSVIVHSFYSEIKTVCKTGRLNKRAHMLMEAAPCGNQGKDTFNKVCYLPVIDGYMGAMNAETKKRIPIVCWLVFDHTNSIL